MVRNSENSSSYHAHTGRLDEDKSMSRKTKHSSPLRAKHDDAGQDTRKDTSGQPGRPFPPLMPQFTPHGGLQPCCTQAHPSSPLGTTWHGGWTRVLSSWLRGHMRVVTAHAPIDSKQCVNMGGRLKKVSFWSHLSVWLSVWPFQNPVLLLNSYLIKR